MWKLEVNGDKIIWRSTFGKKMTFYFDDITYCERKKGSIRVYVNGEKLFTIDSNIDKTEFMEDIKRRRIPVKSYYVNQLKRIENNTILYQNQGKIQPFGYTGYQRDEVSGTYYSVNWQKMVK